MPIADVAKPWIQALGVYEPGRPIEDVARALGFTGADDIIKLASNENALGPSPLAVAAMRDQADQMHLYPDGGATHLRDALARQLELEPGQFCVVNGSNEAIELLGHVFLDPGAAIVMADRAFAVYRLVAAMFQAETIAVPMREFVHDLDAMLAAITERTRVVFIANPNNPTGTAVTNDALDRFMERVPGHVVVALDEAYIELLPPERQPDSLRYVREGRNVFVLRTFSKTYGLAGLRIGYAIGSPEAIGLLNRVRQPFNANAMALAAARAAVEDDEHLRRTRELVGAGLAFFEERLPAMGLDHVPSVVNFVLVKVGDGRRVFDALQREKVIVRPMDVYGLPEYVRITIGTREENETCLKALAKVLAAA